MLLLCYLHQGGYVPLLVGVSVHFVGGCDMDPQLNSGANLNQGQHQDFFLPFLFNVVS